jgi:cytochrome c oxidase accessory protein FixG
MKQDYLKGWIPYRVQRYWVFAIVTIFALVIPFIKIDGAHFFLLNFDHKQIHLFFTKFDMQELYVMPFLLIFGFLGVFFLTTLAGRIWCGWLCPQTIFRVIYRDLIQTQLLGIRKNIKNKQKEPEGQYFKRGVGFILWVILSFIAAVDFIWFFVPPEDFFDYIQNPSQHMVMVGTILIVAGFLIYDVVKLKEDFCIYVCPYARVQSVMYDGETIQTIYNTNRGGHIYSDDQERKLVSNQKELLELDDSAECRYCDSCVRICPTHIDIKRGTQLECLNCLECADACTEVMGKLGKESLITWTSLDASKEDRRAKLIRFKTIAYAIVLVGAFIGILWMGSKKENMLLNINRTTQLYNIKDNGKRVENAYIFLFQNTTQNRHRYYFEVVDQPDIKIARPKSDFQLLGGKKAKKVVVLYTTKTLIKDNSKDSPIPIKIRAYAVDDQNITVFRDTTFVYPRLDEIKQRSQ